MGANVWKSASAWPLTADPPDALLPVRVRRYRRSHRSARADTADHRTSRRLHLRSALPGAESGWSFLLRRADRPAGSLRPDSRRAAFRRPGLHQRPPGARHRGHRFDGRSTCGHSRRRSTPTSPPSWRWSSPTVQVINLNDGILRTSFRDSLSSSQPHGARAGPTSIGSKSGPPVTNSARATASAWRSPAATIRSSRRTRTPANRSARPPTPPSRRRRSCTTPRIRRR